MNACRLFPILTVALLGSCSLYAVQAQNETQPQKHDNTEKQASQLKLIKSPHVPYPLEALKKNIEGKVVLSIVVDASGRVSDAKPLSGPPELFQAAIDSVNQWEFEPPTHAPVVTMIEIGYGHPKACAGSMSDSGEVGSSGRLLNKDGKVVGAWDGNDNHLPPYFNEDRKAGVAGEMVLSVALDAGGKVKEIHTVKSLSPRLDQAAIETVRTWRFKLIDGKPDAQPDDFLLHILYQATCKPQF
jgi:TonB family protein